MHNSIATHVVPCSQEQLSNTEEQAIYITATAWFLRRCPVAARILVHVTKLSVLNIPLKGFLGGLHVSVSDLFQPKGIPGIEISDNDILFDTLKLLPPPHIHDN